MQILSLVRSNPTLLASLVPPASNQPVQPQLPVEQVDSQQPGPDGQINPVEQSIAQPEQSIEISPAIFNNLISQLTSEEHQEISQARSLHVVPDHLKTRLYNLVLPVFSHLERYF